MKPFEYLKNHIAVIKGPLFSHGKTNSCGVAIGCFGTKDFKWWENPVTTRDGF